MWCFHRNNNIFMKQKPLQSLHEERFHILWWLTGSWCHFQTWMLSFVNKSRNKHVPHQNLDWNVSKWKCWSLVLLVRPHRDSASKLQTFSPLFSSSLLLCSSALFFYVPASSACNSRFSSQLFLECCHTPLDFLPLLRFSFTPIQTSPDML